MTIEHLTKANWTNLQHPAKPKWKQTTMNSSHRGEKIIIISSRWGAQRPRWVGDLALWPWARVIWAKSQSIPWTKLLVKLTFVESDICSKDSCTICFNLEDLLTFSSIDLVHKANLKRLMFIYLTWILGSYHSSQTVWRMQRRRPLSPPAIPYYYSLSRIYRSMLPAMHVRT